MPKPVPGRDGPHGPPIPGIGEAKRGVDGYLTYLLRQAGTAVRGAMDRQLVEFGLTFPQYTSLVMINAYPGLSNADLARITLLTPQTVNAVVQTLDRAGMIARTAHATHRKILCLTITEQGALRLAEARQHTAPMEARLSAGLSDGELQLIRHWLTRVAVDASHDQDPAP
jgi:DNA-binding MarR family transcriptional regulator